MTRNVIGLKFQEATLFAMQLHGRDFRKGTNVPYISHLFSVCALVMEDGGSEEEAIAALLHDSLEDHPGELTIEDIACRFGPKVAMLVELCTDTPPDFQGGPKPPWHERKAAYIKRIYNETYPLCRVTLADKLHNIRSIARDYLLCGDDVWTRFQGDRNEQLWYYKELIHAFRSASAPPHLVNEIDSLVRQIEQLSKNP